MVKNKPTQWRHGQPCFPPLIWNHPDTPVSSCQLFRAFLDFFPFLHSPCVAVWVGPLLCLVTWQAPVRLLQVGFQWEFYCPTDHFSLLGSPLDLPLKHKRKLWFLWRAGHPGSTGLFPPSKTSQRSMPDIICITDFIFPAAVICWGVEYERWQ